MLVVQEAGVSLFAGKTAFDEAVKPEVSAAPQAAASQSAFGAANEAGTGPDFGVSSSEVRCSNHFLFADKLQATIADWHPDVRQGVLRVFALIALPKLLGRSLQTRFQSRWGSLWLPHRSSCVVLLVTISPQLL